MVRRRIRKNLELSPRLSVCPSVRLSATRFLRIPSLLFSETLQLVRACNRDKNVPSAFLKTNPVSPILAKNCPKLAFLAQNAQKWRFFAFLSQSVRQNLLIFVLSLVSGVGKNDVFAFFGKIQKWSF